MLDRWPGGSTTLRSIYVRGAGPSVPIYFDNADIDKKVSETKLREIQMQTLTPVHSRSKLPTRTLLKAAEGLPITENQVRSILRKKLRQKIRRSSRNVSKCGKAERPSGIKHTSK